VPGKAANSHPEVVPAAQESVQQHEEAVVRPGRSRDQQNIKENWHKELTERDNTCVGWKKVKNFLADDKSTR
jgi:hypothetical protein